MIVSYDKKFIFFHIGKTGGMSMRHVLQNHAKELDKFKIRRPMEFIAGKHNNMYDVWKTLLLHAKARDAKKELPAELFDNFFKFAFVRNPWDWHVSIYHFILHESESSTHQQVKATGSFQGYLEWAVKTTSPYPKGITKLQQEMITDAQGRLLVDFIGRYETMEQDFNHICHKFGIDEQLPHINKSQHRDYRDYYNEYTKKLVADHFNTDIKMFGYTFDGYSSEINLGL